MFSAEALIIQPIVAVAFAVLAIVREVGWTSDTVLIHLRKGK
jgi:hypothetical protein